MEPDKKKISKGLRSGNLAGHSTGTLFINLYGAELLTNPEFMLLPEYHKRLPRLIYERAQA